MIHCRLFSSIVFLILLTKQTITFSVFTKFQNQNRKLLVLNFLIQLIAAISIKRIGADEG